ncbi:hypothetical protein U1737_08360 [Sphingomonas sp. LB3N6]|uniref:hypothetical protein n=1 Tax=Sphingomonas fucosidasi TaxID=3096164 RepID=UPI002FC8A9F0
MSQKIDPKIAEFLADGVTEVTVEREGKGEREVLKVTFSDGDTSDLMILRRTPDGLVDVTETEFRPAGSELRTKSFVGEASGEGHTQVANYAKAQIGIFSTKSGPNGGNLACVWAVRHLIYRCLGYWVTHTDGTAVFAPELLENFGASSEPDNVSAGGIIISPSKRILGTKKRKVGHVGILAEGVGGNRKIYSNSSSQALWSDRYTLQSWYDRYRDELDLPVYFFPLPEFKKSLPLLD